MPKKLLFGTLLIIVVLAAWIAGSPKQYDLEGKWTLILDGQEYSSLEVSEINDREFIGRMKNAEGLDIAVNGIIHEDHIEFWCDCPSIEGLPFKYPIKHGLFGNIVAIENPDGDRAWTR